MGENIICPLARNLASPLPQKLIVIPNFFVWQKEKFIITGLSCFAI